VEVRDVAHDCRIKPIELLRCNAVQRLDTNLESATRERSKEEHDRIHEEYQGKPIGFIALPERCANVCFGGRKRNRLFMAASHSLYALYVNAQGTPGN
jgi:hypothetical protein